MALKIHWLHNIPSPYRNHRFELMSEVFPALGIEFEVLFMAWTEPDRHWKFRPQDLRYPWSLHQGVQIRGIGDGAHFNPGLLRRLRRDEPQMIVVGGWSAPTTALAPFVTGRRTVKVMESESNFESMRWGGSILRRLKGAIVRRFDAYIVPGPRARALIEWLSPEAARKPFVEFPNLVNEAVFVEGVDHARTRRGALRRELGVSPDEALWVCPARLEEFKGLHLFLPLLEGVSGVTLWVAGEGSLRARLQAVIDERRLPVRLVGQKSEPEMVNMYAVADLFVLPSLSDPSPLSAVEACAAGLPILASSRIGNFDDVVTDGENGWRYDPTNPDSQRQLVRAIASMKLEELARRGSVSRERHRLRFDSRACITRVGEFLLEVFGARSEGDRA